MIVKLREERQHKSAIVFGGSGFIGRHLLKRLADDRCYGRLVSIDVKEPAHRIDGVEYRYGDVRREKDLVFASSKLSGSIDEVFHLAAVHRTPGHRQEEYFETNVMGALNVCAFARRLEVRRIVFTSSIAVYGSTEDPKTEESALNPTSAYGMSKLMAERIHEDWRREDQDRRLVVVRPGVIFGPGENGNMTRLARWQQTGLMMFPGRKDTRKACGYVDDLVQSIRYSIAQDMPSFTYNFCYPQCYTIEEITASYADAGGLPPVKYTAPTSLAMAGAIALDLFDLFRIRAPANRQRLQKMLQSTNIAPKRLLEVGFRFERDLKSAIASWRKSSQTGSLE